MLGGPEKGPRKLKEPRAAASGLGTQDSGPQRSQHQPGSSCARLPDAIASEGETTAGAVHCGLSRLLKNEQRLLSSLGSASLIPKGASLTHAISFFFFF